MQVIVRARPQMRRESFDNIIQGELIPEVLGLRPPRLTVHRALAASRLSVIPFSRRPLALLSLGPFADMSTVAEMVARRGLVSELYRVERSLPLPLPRTWPLGEPTPGVGLLTLLRRRPGFDDERFFGKWFGEHTPMSLQLHPLWGYERNRVREALDGAPWWDGIVEEHFASRSELLDPRRFFGGTLRMPINMLRVWLHVRSFLDLSTLETFLVEERRLVDDG